MRIRLATPDDAHAVLAIYGPYVEGTAVSFELETPSAEEMRGRIVERLARHAWLVAEDDGRLAGYAYLGPFRARAAYGWAAESSVYLRADIRGRGLGTALYGALLELGVRLGFTQVLGGITLPNPASVALHERHGFAPVGVERAVGWKFGRWHDVGWWQRTLQDGPTAPARRALGDLDPAEVDDLLGRAADRAP